jgi:hypothetical protein
MNEEKILIGGEESGGLSTILHIPERDGFLQRPVATSGSYGY